MTNVIKLTKGLDIKLKGKAENILVQAETPEYFALCPTDFPGLVPKLTVKVGDRVKAGTVLFFDKYRPDVRYTSPASGTVVAINRGERRKILEVVVKHEGEMEYESFPSPDFSALSREEILSLLLEAGLFPLIRQRPYGIVANPADMPRDIFISAFDTAPLAPDMDFIIQHEAENFQKGLRILRKLSQGEVHLSLHTSYSFSPVFLNAEEVELHFFSGPHPSGNVGVQIHHVAPVNRGEKLWVIHPQDVAMIGRFFATGKPDFSRILALTGSEVLKPRYYRTFLGASVAGLVNNNVTDKDLRYISGNLLTGSKISGDGFIGFYDSQLTVIPEGKHFEFLGWALPGLKKLSTSRSFPAWMHPEREFVVDTNLHGGRRSFVMTGEYEKVLPMDIYPVHLLKSVLVEDIDEMEQLGIYEVVEEDLALCEFVCTSKTEVQSLIRKGINLMIKEMGA